MLEIHPLGPDKTPLFVIKKAWPVYMEQITLLFQLCLQEEYQTFAFKNAILCVLPKPEKQPRHLPRSYCLIALLSCLGKVLERIVAWRLADIALKSRLLSLLHFGAIPGRSAVDAVATLTYDVERAWENHEVLTALAFDIKGAFDTVTKEKLTNRLWKQGILLSLIRWVASFLKDHTSAIRLDGETGTQEPVQIGVLKGSPLAPILFMLFKAPLFKLFTNDKKKPELAL